jgi:hypothetical protein
MLSRQRRQRVLDAETRLMNAEREARNAENDAASNAATFGGGENDAADVATNADTSDTASNAATVGQPRHDLTAATARHAAFQVAHPLPSDTIDSFQHLVNQIRHIGNLQDAFLNRDWDTPGPESREPEEPGPERIVVGTAEVELRNPVEELARLREREARLRGMQYRLDLLAEEMRLVHQVRAQERVDSFDAEADRVRIAQRDRRRRTMRRLEEPGRQQNAEPEAEPNSASPQDSQESDERSLERRIEALQRNEERLRSTFREAERDVERATASSQEPRGGDERSLVRRIEDLQRSEERLQSNFREAERYAERATASLQRLRGPPMERTESQLERELEAERQRERETEAQFEARNSNRAALVTAEARFSNSPEAWMARERADREAWMAMERTERNTRQRMREARIAREVREARERDARETREAVEQARQARAAREAWEAQFNLRAAQEPEIDLDTHLVIHTLESNIPEPTTTTTTTSRGSGNGNAWRVFDLHPHPIRAARGPISRPASTSALGTSGNTSGNRDNDRTINIPEAMRAAADTTLPPRERLARYLEVIDATIRPRGSAFATALAGTTDTGTDTDDSSVLGIPAAALTTRGARAQRNMLTSRHDFNPPNSANSNSASNSASNSSTTATANSRPQGYLTPRERDMAEAAEFHERIQRERRERNRERLGELRGRVDVAIRGRVAAEREMREQGLNPREQDGGRQTMARRRGETEGEWVRRVVGNMR